MRKTVLFAAFASMLVFTQPAESAPLVAKVNVATQTMEVIHHGQIIHTWRVSTARAGYVTPTGSWRPKRMHRMWHSRTYDMAPMPYSIFYDRGWAIHGTDAVSRLGTPASHGCVRLDLENAAALFALVREIGPGNTRVIVVDEEPGPPLMSSAGGAVN